MSQTVSSAARVSLFAACLAVAASYAGAQTPATSLDEFKMAMVVIGISYFSLILGELVPKRIALLYPERIAGMLMPEITR